MDSPAPCPSGIVRDSLNPQASSKAPPAAPRLDSGECDPRCSLGKEKDRFAHLLKVANRSFSVAQTLSRGLRAPQGERERKVFHFSLGPPLGVQGRQPLARLWGLSHRGESHPGWRGGAPSSRGLWGQKAPTWGVQRGEAPRKEGVQRGPRPLAKKPQEPRLLQIPRGFGIHKGK